MLSDMKTERFGSWENTKVTSVTCIMEASDVFKKVVGSSVQQGVFKA